MKDDDLPWRHVSLQECTQIDKVVFRQIVLECPFNWTWVIQRKSSALPVVGWNWKEEFSHKRDARYIYNIIDIYRTHITWNYCISSANPPNNK